MPQIEQLELNEHHVWGRYLELRITAELIQRTIFLEQGGMNSLHRHDTVEYMTVVSGEVEFTIGPTPDALEIVVLGPGGAITVPATHWHRIRYMSGDHVVDGVACAIINETMVGPHYNGAYTIERHTPAVPSVRHREEQLE